MLLPPILLAQVRCWKKEDRGQRHVFRTLRGGPAGAKLGQAFTAAMKELGIEKVTPHTLRHTAITRLIEAGVSASVISAVCGISVQMLRERYNHSDERVVQVIAHASMDAALTRH